MKTTEWALSIYLLTSIGEVADIPALIYTSGILVVPMFIVLYNQKKASGGFGKIKYTVCYAFATLAWYIGNVIYSLMN